jgi:fibronectin type 3 domain-containing protein
MKSIYIVATLSILALVGCSSNSSNVVSPPTQIDAAPPAIPTDLTGSVADANVMLVWAPNTIDTDVAGYMVYREKGGKVATMISTPLVESWYLDTRPNTSGDNVYRVTCVDLAGNESEYTTITVTIEEERDRSGAVRPELY